jgi:hypothetical protein
MKEVLNAMVQAIGEQAIALGGAGDRVTALEQMLARQFPDLEDELKAQIAADQEHSRKSVYELQVSLAKLRELIAQLPEPTGTVAGSPPEPEVRVQRKKRVSKSG